VRSDSPVSAIRRISAREDIVEALRAALISGEMKPGKVYSAPALAESFGVSATPVREAMLELVREDMVEVARNKGFRVRTLTDDELDGLVEMRLLLEVPTMGRIAAAYEASMDPALDRLRTLAKEIEQAAEASRLVDYIRLDTEFHVDFLSLHGNTTLARTVRELRGRSRMYGLSRLAESGQLVDTVREHSEMIEHVKQRQVAAVEQVITRHIGRVRTDWASGE
jgi:DNA-binding GntR family transcriptional regulator